MCCKGSSTGACGGLVSRTIPVTFSVLRVRVGAVRMAVKATKRPLGRQSINTADDRADEQAAALCRAKR